MKEKVYMAKKRCPTCDEWIYASIIGHEGPVWYKCEACGNTAPLRIRTDLDLAKKE